MRILPTDKGKRGVGLSVYGLLRIVLTVRRILCDAEIPLRKEGEREGGERS